MGLRTFDKIIDSHNFHWCVWFTSSMTNHHTQTPKVLVMELGKLNKFIRDYLAISISFLFSHCTQELTNLPL